MENNKSLARNPSFTPSPTLRKDLELHFGKLGTTARINQIWDRYSHMIRAEAIRLSDAERQVMQNVLSGSFVDVGFITGLELEVQDCDDYLAGQEAARTLLGKLEAASYAQRLAMIEVLGF
ncbi:hypothetical protein [Plesiomonas sp. ZOR0011]|uniref:hypothetical protein n=1 Tax=Plesiomonas sp. ZOR0011 TaxID=1339230 RepID=UPI0006472E63|nr:hypothetical protein [Plesiomonas sp. ZOR0011]